MAENNRLSEKDISRIVMVDGQPELDGKPVSSSAIRASQASLSAEAEIRRHEEGRPDRYAYNTTAHRQLEQARRDLQASTRQRKSDTFEQNFASLQDRVHRSSQPDFLDRAWNRLEKRFPRVMGAIGRALDFIGGGQ